MARPFLAAAVQMRSGLSPERNVRDMERLVRAAAAQGAAYVQTPEMTGALVRGQDALRAILRRQEDDLVAAAAQRLSAELGVWLHVGSTAILRTDGRVANRALLFSPSGELTAAYDKIHMFDVDLDGGESWRESATYEPGRAGVVADLGAFKLGFAICYDVRFPELFRAQALDGAEMLSVPAAFTRQTGEAHWHVLIRARAIENGAWVVAAAQGGLHEDGRETFGHSLIVDPWGRIVAEQPGAEPGVVLAEIDPAASRAARGKIPNLRNARPFGMGGAASGLTGEERREKAAS